MTRRAALKTLLAASVGAVGGTGAYGYLYGRHELEITRAPIAVSGLPPALSGLRVGLLTDLHRSQLVSHEDVTAAVTALMNERPDLIVLGGDYVTRGDPAYVGAATDAMAPLAARKFPVIEGTARRDRTQIFVSRGVGTIYVPVRLNCPPEVALLTLQPA